jgi:predicted ATPase
VRDLPRGTVTFLFTDIEGSTRLLHELGEESYASALAEHRAALREAFARNGGVEVDTQGDAFFVAFPTAPGALAAAGEAQQALALPVRMGLHTGTPLLADEGYVGADVHRASRIAAAGHGGQVLVSSATHALIDPGSSTLLDLGEHRLKDLSAPERLWQLGEREFPRLKTLFQTNLPIPATAFVGREREVAQASELLDDGVRLLTLSGPGGTGKTRLALQAAAAAGDSYPDGLWWVPLATLADPALVLPIAGEALGAKQDVALEIGDRRLLLLLDNFEQVIDAAGDVAGLLAACPKLTVLVTSRERLQVAGEHEYAVPAMASADGLDLFAARARALGTEIAADPAARELCERLDNLPLALELAAARTKLFSPEQLLERLARRLDLFKGGRDADPRQRTLRATIEWSYDLLTPEEQQLFARLSVFRGGCTYEAAEEVCGADEDTLQSLLDKSLLRRRHSAGEPRYWMLETIREYGLERLGERGELDEVRRAHAGVFLELAESRGETPSEGEAWLDLVEADHDNLRSALAWARESGEGRLELRLTVALGDFWEARSYLAEGQARLTEALADDPDAPVELMVRALRIAGLLAFKQGDIAQAREWAETMVRLAEESEDEQSLANALNSLGIILMADERLEEARSVIERGLAISKELGNTSRAQAPQHNLGLISIAEGAYDHAVEELTSAMELSTTLGNERSASNDRTDRAFALIRLGRWREAQNDASESLLVASRLGWRENVAYGLVALTAVALAADEVEGAARLLGQADRLAAEVHLDFAEYVEQLRIEAHETLRSSLGDRLDSLLEEGRAWSLDEAVAAAVDRSLD